MLIVINKNKGKMDIMVLFQLIILKRESENKMRVPMQGTSHNNNLFTSPAYNIQILLKTGSLDNAIREFSLAKPSWYMSHYTMIYKNGERMRDFLGLFGFIAV